MLRALIFSSLFIAPALADELPQAVIITTVTEQCLNPCVTGVGTFTAYNDVTLKAETAGRIEIVHFKEGARAKPGQELFTIYNKEQEAQVKKAEATLKLSQNILKRQQTLMQKGFTTSQEVEKSEAQMKADEALLTLAKAAFAKTKIRAPFEGVLSDRKVCKGAYVKEGDALVRVQDLTPILLTFQAAQTDIPRMTVGDKITAITDIYPDKKF